MSVANVEQVPPFHFGRQTPSSPPFSPQSPSGTHLLQSPTSSPPPPPTSEDIDMSTSTTLPPTGQRHDREDEDMEHGLTNGLQTNGVGAESHEPPTTVAVVELASIATDEDAMDVAPDNSQGLVLPNGSPGAQEDPGVTPTTPETNGVSQGESTNNSEAVPVPTGDAPQFDSIAPSEPPPPADPLLEPPPPPPPVDPVHSDSESSDEDDGGQPWHPIQEDTSSPDEDELKEIEAATEVSALDHEHWEKKAFAPLEDPEHVAGASGRMEWLVEQYNGTKEQPNRELVMKSEPVRIGGYEWQIKFYPKGNDSDYLSVYVDCLSVQKEKAKKDSVQADSETTDERDASVIKEDDPTPIEPQHTPLPLLDSTSVPKRKSIAAQVSVVLYNPSEPRVSYAKTCLHRYCAASPDWGWTRFHGPYYDIPHRVRGQRQALLRGDKLAFTGYIRLVHDETNCLWEHTSGENAWDSFAMTGLQSLKLGEDATAPGGNMISAIASWLLLKPFRQFLYSCKVPDLEKDPFTAPKPLIGALQKVLYMLRTQVQPGAGPVTLDDIMDALDWYGVRDSSLDKLDVISIWECLRMKIEDELGDTPMANAFQGLCGPKKDYSTGAPSYRVPVVGVGSMQEAVNQSPDLTDPESPLPQLLTIELDRQAFDAASRSYVKLLDKVSLDDNIEVKGQAYTLYGFVVHKQTLQSCLYQPILRPEGPGSKWYSYSDRREGNQVKCLTKREAVTLHEGKVGSERMTGSNAVAYIAMYVRNDMVESTFESSEESERWQAPEWIKNEVEERRLARMPPPLPPPSSELQESSVGKETQSTEGVVLPEERQFQVIDSRVFLQHEGPGIFDAYDPRWESGASDLVSTVRLKSTYGCKDIRDKLAAVAKDIKDPRQIRFWFVDAIAGSIRRPGLQGTGKIEYSSGRFDRYMDQLQEAKLQDNQENWSCQRIWVHVVDFADLPELPKEEPEVQAPVEQNDTSLTSGAEEAVVANSSIPTIDDDTQPTHHPLSEDTPMSEPDEPESPRIAAQSVEQLPVGPSNDIPDISDTAMVEIEAPVLPDPPAVDVIIPSDTIGDTEMGGTQDDLPPLPPAPTELPTEAALAPVQERPLTPPPPETRPQTPPPPPDEIYFFVKYFDAEKQVLEPKGSYITQMSSRVEATICKLLDLPPDKKPELCEEEELASTRPLRGRKTFAQNDLRNTTTIVYFFPLTADQRDAIAARAAFADLQPYLVFRAAARNFPSRMNGHFAHNYFSSQYYKGEFKNGHQHGHGNKVYHSGATYEGAFRLSQRHGHGKYTYQNGDTYDGDWIANQQHGNGTFIEAATGNTYVGGWKNDKRFGEGVTHWKNAQETERLCRICWEEAAEAAFYDCGHVVACLGCARQVENCPVCRKRVLSAMKLYYVA